MSRTTLAEIQEELLHLADEADWQAHTAEEYSAARDFATSVRCAKRSFRSLRIIGSRYAIRFEELGNYKMANYINATVREVC